ncbi:MAG: hypothetical protein ABI606_15625 [Rhodoferax sp.]
MNMIKCTNCDSDISPKAAACPKCGHPNEKAKHPSGWKTIGYIALAGVMLWYFAGGGADKQVALDMQKIVDQVATDSANQYQIAKRQGDPIQTCVQASMVSAAYLQANDESNYQRWKSTESEDCERAGVPR